MVINTVLGEKEKEELYGYLYRLFTEMKKIEDAEADEKLKFPLKLHCALEELIAGSNDTPPKIE